MKKIISAKLAGQIVLYILAALLIMHFLIIFRIIPLQIVWGGQIDDAGSNLLFLEVIAISATVLFMVLIGLKMQNLKNSRSNLLINAGTWAVFLYFVVNTIGNFASAVLLENLLFGAVTILLSLLVFRVAIEK
ncbi:MAG: hypothetical protein P8184_09925 [Calditrichia bacterium]